MSLLAKLAIALPLLIGGAAAAAYISYRSGMARADEARAAIARSHSTVARFDPAMVASLPEIARRYFRHAIAPGTPLRTTADIEMDGTFLLGDKNKHQAYSMRARQMLRPPFAFVWMPTLKSGAMTITGSDGLVDGEARTRFWLMGIVPVASVKTTPDVVRSATFRAAVEGLWVPASLLPQNGAIWEQLSSNRARVTMGSATPEITFELTIGADGAVEEVVGQRWSNANPQNRFQLQPFGGTIEGEGTFGGYTIPAQLNVGNHYGTDDYLPFFQANLTSVRYL